MTPESLSAQANQAAQQGQQALNNYNNQSQQYGQQYGQYQNQANQAQQGVQQQTAYLQNAGSGANQYNQALQGYTNQYAPNLQAQLSNANQSIGQLSGQLNQANQQFNQAGGVGGYGLSAGQLGSYEQGILNPLQTGIQTATGQLNAGNATLGQIGTLANQSTTAQLGTEQAALTGLQSVYSNAVEQEKQAQNNMQFYETLAQQQGGLNAQQQKGYADSIKSLADAQNAQASAAFYASQTSGQNLTNIGKQNQLNSQQAAAQAAAQKAQADAQDLANQQYQTMGGYGASSQPKSFFNRFINQGEKDLSKIFG